MAKKIKKKYLHLKAIHLNNKFYCAYCGKKLPTNKNNLPIFETNFPCVVDAYYDNNFGVLTINPTKIIASALTNKIEELVNDFCYHSCPYDSDGCRNTCSLFAFRIWLKNKEELIDP